MLVLFQKFNSFFLNFIMRPLKTDLSRRPPEHVLDECSFPHHSGSLEHISTDDRHSRRGGDVDMCIDWGADVPMVRYGDLHRAGVAEWRPINAVFWKRALELRPCLQVTIKIRLVTPNPVSDLCTFALPSLPAPVTSVICILGSSGDQTYGYRLFGQCLSKINRYSSTLTSLTFLVEVSCNFAYIKSEL